MQRVTHAVTRAAALACMLALLALAVSCCGSLAAHTAASEGPARAREHSDEQAQAQAHAPADWRLLFCPPVLTPWSFDYLKLAWLRAATLVNATAAAEDEGREPQPSQPRARKLLQPGAPPAAANASAQLTAAQLAAVRRFSSWSPGSMPWVDANAVYVRLYKSGNDMFKGEPLPAYATSVLRAERCIMLPRSKHHGVQQRQRAVHGGRRGGGDAAGAQRLGGHLHLCA
jgi:hypothetical protein